MGFMNLDLVFDPLLIRQTRFRNDFSPLLVYVSFVHFGLFSHLRRLAVAIALYRVDQERRLKFESRAGLQRERKE